MCMKVHERCLATKSNAIKEDMFHVNDLTDQT
jgi:hypothetical protein